MTHPGYPVIDRRVLTAPEKRLLRGPRRAPSEMPTPDAHHRLVYRINGDYVLDNAELKSRDDQILAADHVSVVDVGSDVEVRVQLTIRAADESKLTVEVAFVCTVTDPVRVVRSGLNAARVLTSYLEGHHRFYELAIGFPLSQINEIRRHVNAQVTAFTTVQPPRVDGLDVTMASVQVHTPQEWEEYVGLRRTKSYDDSLQTEQSRREFEREAERRQRELLMQTEETKHKQTIEFDEQQQEQLLDAGRRRHDQMMRTEEQELLRRQVRMDTEAYGADPILALTRALQAGKIGEREYAELLAAQQAKAEEIAAAERRDQIEYVRRQSDVEHADLRADREWEKERWRIEHEGEREIGGREHEQKVREIESAHEANMIKLNQQREDALRDLEWRHAQAQQEFTVTREEASRQHEVEMTKLQGQEERDRRAAEEARDDRIRELQWKRDDLLRQAASKDQLIKGLLERGHFDTQPVNIDLQRVVDPMASVEPEPDAALLEEPEAREISPSEPREDD